jgi:hypothetical protein
MNIEIDRPGKFLARGDQGSRRRSFFIGPGPPHGCLRVPRYIATSVFPRQAPGTYEQPVAGDHIAWLGDAD